MPHFICVQCGAQFAELAKQPDCCPVCEDERQFVRWQGQAWTTMADLAKSYRNRIEEDGGFLGIGMTPDFAIDQRALLVETPRGNILWDCVTLVSDEAIAAIRQRGGLNAIAISHPHYYTAMVEWSRAYGNIPIHLHADDRQWVVRDDPVIDYWEGETKTILPGVTLIRCGGHFPGGTVLHVNSALLIGDVIQVVMDRKHVSFMWSFPNIVPLNARSVKRIAAAVAPYRYRTMHGAFWGRNIMQDAEGALTRSVVRYLKAIADE